MDKKALYSILMDRINDPAHFDHRSGIRVTEIGDGWAKGELDNQAATHNLMGILHGGALATLCDSLGGLAVAGSGDTCVTVNSTMNYLHQARTDKVFCHAQVVKDGRKIVVSETRVTDTEGKLIATGLFTYYRTVPIEQMLQSGK